jgi:hypothetical protein
MGDKLNKLGKKEKNFEKAVEYFLAAINLGNIDAYNN